MFKLKNLPLTISLVVVIGLVVGWGINLVLAWTDPTADPPLSNISIPLNVGSTAQSKSGDLTFPKMYDYDNSGYYADPDAGSWFNWIDSYEISVDELRVASGSISGNLRVDGYTIADTICLGDEGCKTEWPLDGDISGSGTANYLAKFIGEKTIGNSIIYDNGKVGIGTDNPLAKLHVKPAGSYECVGSANDCDLLDQTECGADFFDPQYGCDWTSGLDCGGFDHSECGSHEGCQWDNDGFCFGSYSACEGTARSCSYFDNPTECGYQSGCDWRVTGAAAIFENGRVGIGRTNPGYRLELPNTSNVDGRGRANQWVTYSSIRWKENIVPINNALDKVSQLQGVYFDWKPEYGGTPGIGLIAEDVGKVIPEVVDWEDDGIYAKALDYDHLIALLIEAIKEQQQEIEQLKQAIEELKTGN